MKKNNLKRPIINKFIIGTLSAGLLAGGLHQKQMRSLSGKFMQQTAQRVRKGKRWQNHRYPQNLPPFRSRLQNRSRPRYRNQPLCRNQPQLQSHPLHRSLLLHRNRPLRRNRRQLQSLPLRRSLLLHRNRPSLRKLKAAMRI